MVLLTVAEPPRGQHDDLERAAVPPYRAVLARMWQRHAFRHLLAGSTIASMVGFGLNAFLAAYLFRKFGYSVREAGIIAGLIASLPASLGVFGGGWLADRMARRDARSYGTIPGVSLLLATPVYILAVTREIRAGGDRPARARRDCAILLSRAFAGRVPESDAPAHARFRRRDGGDLLFDRSAPGSARLLVGGLSDHFAPDASAAGSSAGLTTALAVTAIFYLWASLHFFRARLRIREELALPL